MKIYKESIDNREQIVVQANNSKFIMGFFACDVYWIMPDYIHNNKFTVKKSDSYLFEFIDDLFSKHHFKNCTFNWLSEARLPQNSSSLKITKGIDFYRIKFIQSPNDYMARLRNICPICFCLSGSRNPEIATKFGIMLNEILTRDFD